MVSMASSNALSDPTKVLQDLYTQQVGPDDFPAQATAHFNQLFATDDALQQVRLTGSTSACRLAKPAAVDSRS